MQVNATLIAAQQAAREAQARFQAVHAPKPQASFASALGETEAFKPLPLKQTAPQPQSPAAPAQAALSRPGALLDITI